MSNHLHLVVVPEREDSLAKGLRYVERNLVRAGMVDRAEDYPWSSAGLTPA